MFLLNMFGRGGGGSEEEKFDRISFKINLNENVPQFHEWTGETMREDQPLQPNDPLYLQLFPPLHRAYQEYVVGENDTLSGIAIKLEVSENHLRELNGLGANIYPGMRIRLPEGIDITRLQEQPAERAQKVRISQLLKPQRGEFVNLKYTVWYYAGLSGYIKGSLTVNANYLIFNPALDDPDNVSKFTVERLLKFNAIVETVDIQDAAHMRIPEMSDSEQPKLISVVQFLLYRVGNSKIEKKYKERLKQLKLDHKAIASMSFALHDQTGPAEETAAELVEKVKELLTEIEAKGTVEEGEEKNRLTSIPFFDIIHENIQPKEPQQKEELNKVIKSSAILGSLSEPSDIITSEEFDRLVLSLPVIYQLYNWGKCYGSTRDGSSFTTFLNKSKGVEPALLLIKEYKGYKLGAFLIENLQTGKTGRGEMFIFSIGEDGIPQVFHWTGRNESFVNCEKDMGVGIGMGFKYGIFLRNDLDRGSSSSTVTFGNEQQLSKKEDFLVEEVEVWGIDSSY